MSASRPDESNSNRPTGTLLLDVRDGGFSASVFPPALPKGEVMFMWFWLASVTGFTLMSLYALMTGGGFGAVFMTLVSIVFAAFGYWRIDCLAYGNDEVTVRENELTVRSVSRFPLLDRVRLRSGTDSVSARAVEPLWGSEPFTVVFSTRSGKTSRLRHQLSQGDSARLLSALSAAVSAKAA